MTDPTPRHRALRTLRVGLALLAASTLVILSPLAWGKSDLNKYPVALGFLGACWGLSCILNGAIDWWRAR
jgi:hypothetical protein